MRADCGLAPAPSAGHPSLTVPCRESCSLQRVQAVTSDMAELPLVLRTTPNSCLERPSCL